VRQESEQRPRSADRILCLAPPIRWREARGSGQRGALALAEDVRLRGVETGFQSTTEANKSIMVVDVGAGARHRRDLRGCA
jgi:hypothetical protein